MATNIKLISSKHSSSTFDIGLLNKVKISWFQDPNLVLIMNKAQIDTSNLGKYTWQNGLLKRKGKLVVDYDPVLQIDLLQHFHISVIGGHSKMDATYHETFGCCPILKRYEEICRTICKGMSNMPTL